MKMTEGAHRVLVVDDDPMVAASVKHYLEREGYAVVALDHPEQALRYLVDNSIDAVVSDVSMPGMSGLEMLEKLRQQSFDVPVIMMTGAPKVEDTMRAMELGAFRYLSKPIERSTLVKVVGEAVRWSRLFRLEQRSDVGAERAVLDGALTRAMDSLWMAYQPIVAVRTRKLVAYEALMRSKEPALPSPPAVLEAAEKLGRLHELGRCIRRLVGEQMSRVEPVEHAFFVNLHAADLADPLLYEEKSDLTRHADQVVLEITERASLETIGDVEGRLASLRERGFRVAVDDLGSGYAGLNYFARISPDIVKIDMGLIRGVDTDPVRQRIVASMCTLASDLGILAVAEGIETEAELECVTELGANLIQGYLTGKPAPYPESPPA